MTSRNPRTSILASTGPEAKLGGSLGRRVRVSHSTLATVVAACFAAVAVATLSARALVLPSPYALVLFGGFSALCLLALALSRYEAAAVLGFALLGVARVEPSPADLLFATLLVVAAATGRWRFDQLPSFIALLLGLLLTVNLVSFVDSVYTAGAVRFFAITAYLFAFAVWLTGYARSRRRMAAVITAYVSGAVLLSAASSLALYLSFPGSELLVFSGGRAEGLFKDPNVFGPFLVPALLIVTEEIVNPRLLKVPRSVEFVAFALLALGVFLSYSRAAWLNATVAIVVLVSVIALRRGGFKRAIAVMSLLAVAGMLVVAVVAVTNSTDFLATRTRYEEYDVERFSAQRAGIGLVAQHPFGIGPGQFQVVLGYGAHSLYVRSLAEQGVLGLAMLLLLVTITLLLALSNVGSGRDTYGLGSATLLAAWCGIILNSLFVDTIHWRHLWMVAAFIWVGATRAQVRRQ